MTAVAVVARGEEVAAARVLARSLARLAPGAEVTVLVLPGLRPALDPPAEPFAMLTPARLEVPAAERLLSAAPAASLAALLRPLLAAHLLEAGADRVLVLAPDAEAHGPLDAWLAQLDRHAAVLAPRLTGQLPDDDRRPDGRDLLEAGRIDDALVAVRGDEAGRALVGWWTERALEAAEAAAALKGAEAARHARLTASPLDAAETVFGELGRLEDPGFGVSYWNLHERPLAAAGEGITAAGSPLRLMRWAGFRPDRPWWLSEHGTRVLVLDDPVIADLVKRRAAALLDAGWLRPEDLDAAAGELTGGIRYDGRLRRLHAEAVDAGEDFGDVFTPAGAEALLGWLGEPASHGGTQGVNRYALDAWRERDDVRAAYADLDGADAEGFLGWLWVHGRDELGLQRALLPAPPAWVEERSQHVPSVLVTGYLRGTLGLGQAARGYTRALTAAGVPVGTRSVATDPPVERLPRGAIKRPEEVPFTELELPQGAEPEVNLVAVNADQLPGFVEEAGDEILRGRYTIGQWAWETSHVPERWDAAFELVDELWVYSNYVAEHVSRAGDVPVVVMPLPVQVPDPRGATVPFELPDAFLFLYAFDFFSTLQRKNPLGLVQAFRDAFAPGEGPVLLLKTINARFRPEAHERLRHAIAGRPDILLVDRTLSAEELAALYVRADAYVSLHRAEGYGLTIAEAMALGKPAVATGYSGNTDFMTPGNSYLVDWELTEVGDEAEHYPSHGTWAEPSLEHAAALMREVYEDRDGARRRGERAAADIAATLSDEAVGALARERLVRIAARRAGAPVPGERWLHPDLPGRLHFDLDGRGPRGGPRGAVRRGLFRALRPYASSQRALDETLVEAIRRLSVGLDAQSAATARERRRAARLDARLEQLENQLAALRGEGGAHGGGSPR